MPKVTGKIRFKNFLVMHSYTPDGRVIAAPGPGSCIEFWAGVHGIISWPEPPSVVETDRQPDEGLTEADFRKIMGPESSWVQYETVHIWKEKDDAGSHG